MGSNPFQTGQASAIPYVVTHDGRTIRYPDPAINVDDTIKFDIKTSKISGHLKFEVGHTAMVTRGANIGRIGVVISKEKHPGSFEIVHLRDKKGNEFATRVTNVFIIGDGSNNWISLPKEKGIRSTIIEERQDRVQAIMDKAVKKVKAEKLSQ